MKNYLFIIDKPAYSGAYAQELLDLVLTTAAFDQKVTLLWIDDAVFQLKQHQQALIGQKDIAAMLQALALYDITDVYIEAESLQERGLSLTQLILPVQTLSRAELSQFMQQFAIIC